MYCQFLRKGLCQDDLARTYFGDANDATVDRVNSILRTWIASIFTILKAETWWLSPAQMHNVSSSAFASEPNLLCIGDCTNVNTGNSHVSEEIGPQLYSSYYAHTCGKYCVCCSVIGGTVACGAGMGGPANDHECIEMAGLFDPEKWTVPDGDPNVGFLYDAGVHSKTRSAFLHCGAKLNTSAWKRKSKHSTKSFVTRQNDYKKSNKRIRVENFIGIVKAKFKILRETIPVTLLGMLDKIVYSCFMLHNFGPPIIK